MSSARSLPPAANAVEAPPARPLRSILAIADFSPKSDNAMARAALLAREHGATFRLLHVVAPRRFAAATLRRPERDLRLVLERAGATLATLSSRIAQSHGVSAACNVRAGDTLEVILEEAQHADLVVLAAKGTNPLRDFVLRTPTERLLRMLRRPVLIVKRPAIAPYAAPLASSGGAVPESAPEGAPLGAVGASEEFVIVAKDGQAAMGTFLLGNLAQRLVAQAACDVLILPTAVADAANGETRDVRGRRIAFAIDARTRARPKTA